jgi:HAD superfamily hydrolase (TIGR01484 family)
MNQWFSLDSMLLSWAVWMLMKSLSDFSECKIRVVLTDIDGTLTQQGRLPAHSYASLWKLHEAGLHVIPVTGRPAGWCELIARLWPVHGVIGENGALYFRLQKEKMLRYFARAKPERRVDREKLRAIRREILQNVPGCAVASDQFSRLFDLAIDSSEDVRPLPAKKIREIVKIFENHGATAKVSNIHVNGWFGDYDKVTTCQKYLRREFGYSVAQMKEHCIFVGDSPNDEPMFQFFPHSFAVANIKEFLPQLKFKPAYVASSEEGLGFNQVADRVLACHR